MRERDAARAAARTRGGSGAKAAPAQAAPAAAPAAAAAWEAAASKGKQKRLTNWQEKELKSIESKIASVEELVRKVDERLADPKLYTGPRADLERAQADRQARAAELKELYARWEELEALRG